MVSAPIRKETRPVAERAADPADDYRQAEAAEPVGIVGRGENGRDIGADGDEAGNADVEEAGLAPLHVEAEADDAVGQRHGQEEGAVAEQVEAHVAALPKMPCGRSSSTSTRMTKATARAPFRADQLDGEGLRQADDQAGEHRARHRADAAKDGGGEQRQQQVEAHLRADLHEQPGADAGDAGERPRRAARRCG